MQRNTPMWAYFLCLVLGIAMTVALLPACSNSSGSGCNTKANAELEDDTDCELEEVDEEEEADEDEIIHEAREETGVGREEAEFEIETCEGIACNEVQP